MTSPSPRPKRSTRGDGSASRSSERAREMRERAEASMTDMRERAEVALSYEDGVVGPDTGQPPVEESPYEKFFTGGDTAIPKPQPLRLDTAKVILLGTVGWVIALAVVLLVPALHTDHRHWWPWTCVAGIVLGLLGFAYIRRGRGNAEAA